MRVIGKGSELKAAAYAGTYVVVLAWDTLDGKMPSRTDLLGYAIERAELDLSGNGGTLLDAGYQAVQGTR
jgi:drug/metabolite transporter superfamily protein YnfA